MQSFKNGRGAELFMFDGDFALRRIKGEAPLWHRVLPLDGSCKDAVNDRPMDIR